VSALRAVLDRLLARVDALQATFRPSAVVVGVIKRYGDDRGGMYAALITFYGLLSVFPLLLLFVTIASRILGPQSKATEQLLHSALEQFPVVGTRLADNIHSLNRGSTLATVASALFLLWGSLGVTSALQTASHRMWRLPRRQEPTLVVRSARGLLLLLVVAASVVLATAGAAVSSSGYLRQFSTLAPVALFAGQVGVNLVAYLLALRVLSPAGTTWRSLLPGTLVGGLGWSLLQQFGGYLISHQLHRTSEIYGFFAIVLGLIFWLNIGAQLFLLSSELNIVLLDHDWPRSLVEPPLEASLERRAAQPAPTPPS
jgi:YihY family inner membrane protein